MSGPEPTSPTLGYAAVLNITVTIGIVYDVDLNSYRWQTCPFARLFYTVFNVQGNYALFGLRIRGVSAIQGFLMYTSNGSSIRT